MYMRFVATSVTMSERSTGEPVVIICDISVKVLRGNLCRDLESRSIPESQPEMIDCTTLGEEPNSQHICGRIERASK